MSSTSNHADNIFEAKKSDSTLILKISDTNPYNMRSYNRLLKELNLN